MKDNKISKHILGLTNKIAKNRAKILNDFAQAYLASIKGVPLSEIELVEQRNGLETTWHFRRRKNSPHIWKIRYLAALPGEKVKEDGMLFKSYKEAENYLREMTDDCPYKIPMYDGGKGCEACMAQWDIVEDDV